MKKKNVLIISVWGVLGLKSVEILVDKGRIIPYFLGY